MAIKSILAEFGDQGEHGKVYLGGAEALNLLGSVSASVSLPTAWADKLDEFLRCQSGETFRLGGFDIVRTGYYVKAKGMSFTETQHGDGGSAYWELGQHEKRGQVHLPGGDDRVGKSCRCATSSENVPDPIFAEGVRVGVADGNFSYAFDAAGAPR